jgi:hypothetical protein
MHPDPDDNHGNEGQEGQEGPPDPGQAPARPGPDPARLVTLQRMQVMEAQLAAARLESEGIQCLITDQEMAITHPLVVTEVRLLVQQKDLATARHILANLPPPAADDQYVDTDWRCPSCHRRAVDLLPLPPAWRRARLGCLTLVSLGIMLAFASQLIDNEPARDILQQIVIWGWLPWALTILILTLALVSLRHRRRCRECGHEWHDRPDNQDQPS